MSSDSSTARVVLFSAVAAAGLATATLLVAPERRREALRFLWNGNVDQERTRRRLESAANALSTLERQLEGAAEAWEGAPDRESAARAMRPVLAELDASGKKVEVYVDATEVAEESDRDARRQLNVRLEAFFEQLQPLIVSLEEASE